MIHTGAAPTDAEWDITVPNAGTYQLELRYAAEQSRPMKISLNGSIIRNDAAGTATGGWFPDNQKWEPQAIVTLKTGKNVLRIERSDAIPHIDKLAFIPVPAGAAVMKTAIQIAKQYGVNPEIAETWAKVLSASDKDPIFGAWAAFAKLPKEDFGNQAVTLAQKIAAGKNLPFVPVPAYFAPLCRFPPRFPPGGGGSVRRNYPRRGYAVAGCSQGQSRRRQTAGRGTGNGSDRALQSKRFGRSAEGLAETLRRRGQKSD